MSGQRASRIRAAGARLGPGLVAVLVLAGAVAGCRGGSSAGSGGSSTSAGSTASSGSTSSGPATSTPASATSSGSGGGPSATPSVTRTITRTGLTAFTTPSKNIGCYLEADTVRCDIAQRSWSPPPKPASCDVDWGQGLSMESGGKPGFVCAGDTALDPNGMVLAYGTALRVGPTVCTSLQSGVRCQNLRTLHGFALSRESYSIF